MPGCLYACLLVCFPRAEPPSKHAWKKRRYINLQGGYGFGRENEQISTDHHGGCYVVSQLCRPTGLHAGKPPSSQPSGPAALLSACQPIELTSTSNSNYKARNWKCDVQSFVLQGGCSELGSQPPRLLTAWLTAYLHMSLTVKNCRQPRRMLDVC